MSRRCRVQFSHGHGTLREPPASAWSGSGLGGAQHTGSQRNAPGRLGDVVKLGGGPVDAACPRDWGAWPRGGARNIRRAAGT